jgi:hypothetical protein
MTTNKILEICCTNPNCKTWFRSPFSFGNINAFDVNAFKGLQSQCPTCGNMVSGSKENIRILTIDGHWRYNKSS